MNRLFKSVMTIALTATVINSAELNFDIKGGLNLATMFSESIYSLIDDGFDKTPTPAFCGGIGLELSLSERFSIQPELLLTMKGTEFTKKVGDIQEQMDAEYIYLCLPVLLKMNRPIGKLIVHPFIGVVPSLLIISDFEKSRSDLNNPSSDYDITVDTKDRIRSGDFGIAVGLETEIPLRVGSLLFDIRNTTSILDTEFNPTVNGYHTVFSFMAGYRFSFRK